MNNFKKIETFLNKPRIAVVSTIKKDGTSQLSPNWYIYLDGAIYISTTKKRAKYWNLLRDNRVSLCIYSEPLANDYVVIEGKCDILPKEKIFPITEEIVKLYVPVDLVLDRVAQIKKEDRVLLKIIPDKYLSRFWGTFI
ncbi:MAG: hypothetical protein CL764_02720 [Chloroflexi bacterium]|nr:hypothetical protein [Chloroflexota bacterium]|tara:strand:- start:5449 stop:5865 length:417 start_codon:yes stop_codon:yes gene_type:complete